MNGVKCYCQLLWFTLAGMAAGYLLVHPFAMLAYTLGPHHQTAPLDFSVWGRQVHLAFSQEMLVMGGALSLIDGIAGLCIGAWHLQRVETQRRQAALEILRELMVTLAHHISNANMIIGGFSAHIQKHIDNPKVLQQLRSIHQASHEIDKVIIALEGLAEINYTENTSSGQTRMIDLKQQLETRLKAPKADEHQEPSVK